MFSVQNVKAQEKRRLRKMSKAKEEYYNVLEDTTYPPVVSMHVSFNYIKELEEQIKELKALLSNVLLEKKQGIKMYNSEEIEEALKDE
jgi:uncharacterized protein YdeI (YjbR/CyaY-like superfamily)